MRTLMAFLIALLFVPVLADEPAKNEVHEIVVVSSQTDLYPDSQAIDGSDFIARENDQRLEDLDLSIGKIPDLDLRLSMP